jgi:hypothetical protein
VIGLLSGENCEDSFATCHKVIVATG